MTIHTAMIYKAARALSDQAAEECGVDKGDNWNTYSEIYTTDARAALEACGAFDLLTSLKAIIGNRPDDDQYGYKAAFNVMHDDIRKAASAAVVKATVVA